MKFGILHLSDLHIESINDSKTEILSRIDKDKIYVEKFIDKINELIQEHKIDYLIVLITGDLSNRSEKKEYQKVQVFLETIKNDIKVKKLEISIIPGNHDLNWLDLQHYVERELEENSTDSYKYHEKKFENFSQFFEGFYKDEEIKFDPDSAVSYNKTIDDKIVLLGINSNYKESYNKHIGYVDTESLKEVLKKNEVNWKDKYKIAFMHHTPFNYSDDTGSTLENWDEVRFFLLKYGFNIFFFGHVHTGDVKGAIEEAMSYYSIAGSFSKIIDEEKYNNEFNFFVENSEEKETLCFDVLNYVYFPKHKDWQKMDITKNSKQLIFTQIESKLSSGVLQEVFGEEDNKEAENLGYKIKKDFTVPNLYDKEIKSINKYIISIVRENRLFKSGHFHWGNNSRSHGWINTNKLLSDYRVREYINQAIKWIIHGINTNYDIIIGIGMEGCLLGSRLNNLIDDALYLYYPLDLHGHNEYEKLIENNVEGSKVLVITDVVYRCNSIKKMIDKEEAFFNKVEKIDIISIFYSGNDIYSIDMFKNKDLDTFIDDRVDFFRLCDMKVQSCPYDNIKDCEVFMNKLDTVYTFYEGDE